MSTSKKTAGGTRAQSARRRSLRALALPRMEHLEPRMLPAGIIHIYAGATNTTIPAGAQDFSNTTDYNIDPVAFTSATSAIHLEATTSITFSDPVENVPVALEAESQGFVEVDANLSTTAGHDITLIGTNSYQASSFEGSIPAQDHAGVMVSVGAITSGGGLTVGGTGLANDEGGGAAGVDVEGGTLTTSGLGSVSVTGNMGTVQNPGNSGVELGNGGIITSGGGGVTIVGLSKGNAGDAGSNIGVNVLGGTITAGGVGAVSVTGTGGVGGSNDAGVSVRQQGQLVGSITSGGGNVSVTGTGGGDAGQSANDGVYLFSGTIGAGGVGNVSVTGTGGLGTGAVGVALGEGGAITSSFGNITVAGTGSGDSGGSGGNDGVGLSTTDSLGNQTANITAGGTGSVSVTGHGGVGAANNYGILVSSGDSGANTIASTDGDVTLNGTGGGTAEDAGTNAGVDLSGSAITAGGTGSVSVTGHGGVGAANNYGVYMESGYKDGNSNVASNNGDVTLNGTGGGDADGTGSNQGIFDLGGTMTSGGTGSLHLTGTGGAGGGGNDGVNIQTSAPLNSQGGDITLTGTGGGDAGGAGSNTGVELFGAAIAPGGAGSLVVTGTGGVGDTLSDGVNAEGRASLTTGGGGVTVTGTGGGNSAGTGFNYGIFVNAATIAPGSLGAVALHGFGGLGASTSKGVVIENEGLITSSGGDVSISGAGGTGPSANLSNNGVYLTGASITAGGVGSVAVDGFGGTGSSTAGIDFETGAVVTTNDGDITISGTGGSSTDSGAAFNTGVYMSAASITVPTNHLLSIVGQAGDTAQGTNVGVDLLNATSITSDDGIVSIKGTGGGDASGVGSNYGVEIDGTSGVSMTAVSGGGGGGGGGGPSLPGPAGGTVAGAGNVSVTGTGGTGGSSNFGVYFPGGAPISTSSGDVTIDGTGGGASSSSSNYGVYGYGASITAGGSASITGIGGVGNSDNYGVYLYNGASVSTGAGDLTLDGTGGGTNAGTQYNYGVYLSYSSLTAQGSAILSGTAGSFGSGDVGIFLQDGAVTSNAAAVVLTGQGGGDSTGSGSNSGMNLTGASISASTTASITGTGGLGQSGSNYGIELETGTAITTQLGDVAITATGGRDVGANYADYGLYAQGASITAGGAGSVRIVGVGGANGGNNNGIDMEYQAYVATTDGDITLAGTAGGDGASYGGSLGIYLYRSSLAAGGAGKLTLDGQGGPGGGNNDGVYIDEEASLTTAGGDIAITGTGGGNQGAGSGNDGVYVDAASINAGGAGSVSIDGTGGLGDAANDGVDAEDGAGIVTNNGDVRIHGTAGGDSAEGGDNYGVNLGYASILPGGTGALVVVGIGGPAGDSNTGLYIGASSVLATNDGDITLTGTGGSDAAGYGDNMGLVIGGASIGAGGAGGLTITGTGGLGRSGNFGVELGSGASLTTDGGDIAVSGTAVGNQGTTEGYGNDVGVQIDDVAIYAGGSGSIGLTGTAAAAGGYGDVGLAISGGSSITAVGGSIQLSGTGGGQADSNGGNIGVHVDHSEVDAGGAGSIAITGAGGAGFNGDYGVNLDSASQFRTDAGDITVTGLSLGTAGAYGYNVGVGLIGTTVAPGAGSSLIVKGTGGLGLYYNFGVQIVNGSSLGSSQDDIAITGIGGGDGTGEYNHGVFVQYSTLSPGTTGSLAITGAGGRGILQNDGIVITTGSSVTTTDGDLTLKGTAAGIAGTAGQNVGVYVGGATVAAGGEGVLEIDGGGGLGDNSNFGIQLDSGDNLSTVAGDMILRGTAGGDAGGSGYNYGVRIAGVSASVGGSGSLTITGIAGLGSYNNVGTYINSATLATNDGNLAISGTGGGDANQIGYNYGVSLSQAGLTAGGAGTLTLTGVSGLGNTEDLAVYIDNGTSIASNNGDIRIKGTAGGDANGQGHNYGVYTNGTTVSISGAGALSISGTGGSGLYENYGVQFEGATALSTTDGDITVAGSGGGVAGGYGNEGLNIYQATISAGGAGAVNLTGVGGRGDSGAFGVDIESSGDTIDAIVSTNAGGITVTGTGGGDAAGYGSNLGLYMESAEIMAGGSGTVQVTGTGGLGGVSNVGIEMDYYDEGSPNSSISSSGGDVTLIGTGGGVAGGDGSNYGVYQLAGDITAGGSGAVHITGTGGLGNSDSSGYLIEDGGYAPSTVGTSGGGLTITGHGGGDLSGYGRNYGVVDYGIGIAAGGAGATTLVGTGGSGSTYNYGVYLTDDATVTSSGGDVSVTGTGGTSPFDENTGDGENYGVYLHDASTIAADGSGSTTVTGTGGTGGSYAIGVELENSTITANQGDVLVSGTGGTSANSYDGGNEGVYMDGASLSAAGGYSLTLTGQGGTSLGSYNAGLDIEYGSSVSTVDGSLTITGRGAGTAEDYGHDDGLYISGSSIGSSGVGGVDVTGDAASGGGGRNVGVEVDGGAVIGSSNGGVTVSGYGAGLAYDGGYDSGVLVENGALITTAGTGFLYVTGTGGAGDGNNDGVEVTGSGSSIASNGGGLQVSGSGGGHAGDSGYNVGVSVGDAGTIIAGATDFLHVNGTGGLGGGNDYGIMVSVAGQVPVGEGAVPAGEGSTFISGNGSTNIEGDGGGSNGSQGFDDGVHVDTGGQILTTGADGAYITGYGGHFGQGSDDGVRVTDAGSVIGGQSTFIEVYGYGGGASNSSGDVGIAALAGGQLTWGGSGEAYYYAVGGSGTGGDDGILVNGSQSAFDFLSAEPDTHQVIGAAGQGAGSFGIHLTNDAAIEESDPGLVAVELQADTLDVDDSSSITFPQSDLTLNIGHAGTISGNVASDAFEVQGGGELTLVGENSLELGQVNISQSFVVFADIPALDLGDQPVYAYDSEVQLGTGSTVSYVELDDSYLNGSNVGGTAGDVYSDGGSLVSPGTFSTTGIINVNTLTLSGSSDEVELKLGASSDPTRQPTPGADYDQIRVVSGGISPTYPESPVNLNGANLNIDATGAFPPSPGSFYTLISNPTGVPINGTFNGLPEGATVDVGGLPFTISYQGGADGTDVVLYFTGSTVTTVASLSGPSTYGQVVTLQASVRTVDSSLIPNGVVDFYLADDTFLGSAALDPAGNAVLSTALIPAGEASTVYADYEGAAGFLGSEGVVGQQVSAATPAVQLSTSLTSTDFGQVVTLFGSVLPSSPGVATPTGTVTFYDVTTDTDLAANVPLVDGHASLSVSNLDVEGHSIVLVFDPGDANYLDGESLPTTVTVNADPTTVSVSQSVANPVAGQAEAYTIVVGADAPGAGLPTGHVDIYEGETLLAEVPVVSGVATFTTTGLAAGGHALDFDYSGDPDFQASAGAATTTVSQASTAATLAISSPTTLYGQAVTLTATINPVSPGSGFPDGTVTFIDTADDASYGPVSLVNGVATFTTSGLSTGDHTFVALYSGGSNFLASQAAPRGMQVQQADTKIVAIPSAAPAPFGGPLTLYVGVAPAAPGAGTPTGTLAYQVDNGPMQTIALGEGGAQIPLAGLPVGTHTVAMFYQGDANFNASTSQFTQVVATDAAAMTVTLGSGTIAFGQATTATVTLTGAGAGLQPTGDVILYVNGTPYQRQTLAAASSTAGAATFTLSGLHASATPYVLTAVYQGDVDYASGTSSSADLAVNPLAASVAGVVPSPATVVVGQAATLSASVPQPSAGIFAVGHVEFLAGSTVLGVAPLVQGAGGSTATLSGISFPHAANMAITAIFVPDDADFTAGAPAQANLTVAPGATLLSINDNPTTASFGSPVTFTVQVAPVSPATGPATGSVQLFDGATPLGSATLVDGSASFSGIVLATGTTHAIRAIYVPTADYLGSSATTSLVEGRIAPASATLAPASASISFGQAQTMVVTVVGINGVAPTGFVQLNVDGQFASQMQLVPGAGVTSTATFQFQGLATGTHSLSAIYEGDATYLPLATPSAGVAVSASSAQVGGFTPSVASPAVDQPISLSATVAAPPGASTAGVVVFIDTTDPANPVILGRGPVVNGTATVDNVVFTTPGPHTVALQYLPDGVNVASTSAGTSLTVVPTPTTTTLAVSPATAIVSGQAVVLSAHVASAFGPVPVGSVTFFNGATPLGTATVDYLGNASLTVASLPVGSDALSAGFVGSSTQAGSTSAVTTQVVASAPSTATVQSSTMTAGANQSVTFPVTIAAAPGAPTPTGTVTYYDGSTVLGTVPLDASGHASLTVAGLPAGQHTITVVYNGDAHNAPSSAAVGGLTITAAAIEGPTVVSLKRFGYHTQPTALVLAFSNALNATSAQLMSNYTITLYGKGKGKHAHAIKVKSASYDPNTRSVILLTSQRLNYHKTYQLTVNGVTPSGVSGQSGTMLNAASVGTPGSNYTGLISSGNLAGSYSMLTTLSVKAAAPAPALAHQAVDHILAAGALHGHGRRSPR